MEKEHQNKATIFDYMDKLKSKVVEQSGIPTDEYHIGKTLLMTLKNVHDPNLLLTIDSGTGETETFESALKRSIQCAIGFREMGLKVGDVIDLCASNYVDLTIPVYAAMYLGLIVTQTDPNYSSKEMQHYFSTSKPKLIFCTPEKTENIKQALDELKMKDTKIMTIGDENGPNNFRVFLRRYQDIVSAEFRATDLDPKETISFLVPTSGTTGLPKLAALTHKSFLIGCQGWWIWHNVFPKTTRLMLIWAPFQWISTIGIYMMSGILHFTKLQTSQPMTVEHYAETVNKYKPSGTVTSPTFLTRILRTTTAEELDLKHFVHILIGGSAVTRDMVEESKVRMPNVIRIVAYGMSEMSGLCFQSVNATDNNVGKQFKNFKYRLVDTETGKDITEPNVQGELWVTGDAVFKGYYNNPKGTADTFSEDGWLKTGDIFYRDDDGNHYFVDRHKLMLKYKNYSISPVEIEIVIRQHPGVEDVAVSSIQDAGCGDLPVACVKRREHASVSAEEIKDLVKNSLSENKQLWGGVIFMESLPVTVTGKINRKKLKEMVYVMDKE